MKKQRENWMSQGYFTYLYALRDSGVTNMWGASQYLEDEHGLEPADAQAVCSVWFSDCVRKVEDDKRVDIDEYNELLKCF
jgi:hypothetical protein